MEHPSKKWYAWIPIILLISTLFTLECVAVHHLFTTRFPGANDFYAPWAGARALLREGRDPYSPEVTAEIQEIKGIDPSLREKGKGGFAKLTRGVVFLFLVGNLAWQTALLMQEGSIPVVLGLESRKEYLLDHNNPPYGAIHFINQLPSESKVFFVGNGQSYYVNTEHMADVNHANWGHLIYRYGERPEQLHQALISQGFTHIFYSGYDFEWQLEFDAEGQIAEELTLFDQFVENCARLTYDAGENSQIYTLQERCE
jgi:hypothetical protein